MKIHTLLLVFLLSQVAAAAPALGKAQTEAQVARSQTRSLAVIAVAGPVDSPRNGAFAARCLDLPISYVEPESAPGESRPGASSKGDAELAASSSDWRFVLRHGDEFPTP